MTSVEDQLNQAFARWTHAAPSDAGLLNRVHVAARRRRLRKQAALCALTVIAVLGVAIERWQPHPPAVSKAGSAECLLDSPVVDTLPGFTSLVNEPHPAYPHGISAEQAKQRALDIATVPVPAELVSVVKSRWDQALTVIGPPGAASNFPADRCVYTVTVRAPGRLLLVHPIDVPAFSVLFDVATGSQVATFGAPPVPAHS